MRKTQEGENVPGLGLVKGTRKSAKFAPCFGSVWGLLPATETVWPVLPAGIVITTAIVLPSCCWASHHDQPSNMGAVVKP